MILSVTLPTNKELTYLLSRPDHGYLHMRLIRNVSIFAIGFVGFVAGTYVSLAEIIKTFGTSE